MIHLIALNVKAHKNKL